MQDGEWLNDNIITPAQILLKKKYPKVSGFQCTAVIQIIYFAPEGGQFIQIL